MNALVAQICDLIKALNDRARAAYAQAASAQLDDKRAHWLEHGAACNRMASRLTNALARLLAQCPELLVDAPDDPTELASELETGRDPASPVGGTP